MVVQDWAPQAKILGHGSIGGDEEITVVEKLLQLVKSPNNNIAYMISTCSCLRDVYSQPFSSVDHRAYRLVI
ncbi:hypothetical protein CUMW_197200 [Citrus unshiu]|nr:hypothetical protein CUMW_197200 [Citrus unshiu]